MSALEHARFLNQPQRLLNLILLPDVATLLRALQRETTAPFSNREGDLSMSRTVVG